MLTCLLDSAPEFRCPHWLYRLPSKMLLHCISKGTVSSSAYYERIAWHLSEITAAGIL